MSYQWVTQTIIADTAEACQKLIDEFFERWPVAGYSSELISFGRFPPGEWRAPVRRWYTCE